jgi:ribosomal-protein-alanine N-acetyltransferase
MSAHCTTSSRSEPTVDRFRLRDLIAVRRLEKDSFGAHAFDATMFLYFALSRSHRFLVAREGAEMVGYLVAQQSAWGKRKLGHIVSIAVREDRRGSGLGALLMAAVLDQLREAGVEEIVLEVGQANERAQRLYRRFGFQVDRTLPDFYGPDQHGLRMTLEITRGDPARRPE